MKTYPDITGDIGQMVAGPDECKYPMYSYSRIASHFWQGFYEGLRERKFTHEQAINEMQSKGVRWMLDGDADKLSKLGAEMAKTYEKFC